MVQRIDQIIWDMDMSFAMNPLTGDISIKTGYEAVAQSLKNLILNKKLWNFESMDIHALLFENLDNPLLSFIAMDQLKEKLLQKEPRLNDVSAEMERDDYNQNLIIRITFSLKTNKTQNVTFPIFIRNN